MSDPGEYKRGLLAHVEKVKKFTAAGYAGIDQHGTIVDRREHPEAIPIQKNTMMDVPEPKPVKKRKRR